MKKKVIKLSEEELNKIVREDHSDYYIINEEIYDFDSEKGFVDVRLIVGQESTGKLFALNYTKGGQGDRWYDKCELQEVIARKKTITVYE